MLKLLFYSFIILESSYVAADVILGDAGSNECPLGREKITSSIWSCRAAMSMGDLDIAGDQDGETFEGVENDSDWPRGCYYIQQYKISWLNNNLGGSGHSKARLYCATPGLISEGPFTDAENKVLFVGDSDVDYWRDTHLNVIPNSYNFGVGGYTCKNVKNEMTDMLNTMQGANLLVLVCGENDLVSTTVEITFSRLTKVVNKAIDKGRRIIMLGTKPEPSTTSLHSSYREYDNKVKDYAKCLADKRKNNPPPLIFIDVYSAFESMGNPSRLYDSDNLHLSSDGYAFWSQWTKQAYEYDKSVTDASTYCVIWKNGVCMSQPTWIKKWTL